MLPKLGPGVFGPEGESKRTRKEKTKERKESTCMETGRHVVVLFLPGIHGDEPCLSTILFIEMMPEFCLIVGPG